MSCMRFILLNYLVLSAICRMYCQSYCTQHHLRFLIKKIDIIEDGQMEWSNECRRLGRLRDRSVTGEVIRGDGGEYGDGDSWNGRSQVE